MYYNLSLVFKFHYHDGPFLFYFEPNACRIEVIDWLLFYAKWAIDSYIMARTSYKKSVSH